MGALGRRLNGALSTAFPEKRLFIQSGDTTRYIRLTSLSQLLSGTAALVALGWMAVATATVVIDRVAAENGVSRVVVLQGAYEARLEELAAERDLRAGEARSAQERFQVAMEQVSRQQTAILQSVEERRELATALDLMRARLQDAVGQRDTVAAANDRLLDQMNEVNASLASRGASGADLTDTLRAVSGALAEAAAARDIAAEEGVALQQQLTELELRARVNSQRQDEMIDELEQAIALSFGPLEQMFSKSKLDVDGLIATVRDGYTGQGGPEGRVSVSTRSFDDPGLGSRFDKLMLDLDRMNLMRIAATKLPYAMPVTSTFRFTSGFGYRNDPKGRGARNHAGIDMAAPRGTAIFSTADGVVESAKYESGYGNVVRIRHEFGFETVYAHQNKIRVRQGQQVSRGERIGDMGSTGRSTGSHLHYEVHVNGTPVNPMIYLEAAKDVF
jgi:murein DD-endopeptidase MepM/ murein hydrolase activator NlpD